MSDFIEAILLACGIPTVISAFLMYYIKGRMTQKWKQDMEDYKAKIQSSLDTKLEDYKSYIQRDLAINLRRDMYIKELAVRQLDAIQEMWSVFECASLSGRPGNMIRILGGKPEVDFEIVRQFLDSFNKAFSAKSGLYISKESRVKLYAFRDFIKEEVYPLAGKSKFISKSQVDSFKSLRRDARISLRKDVGSDDLTVSREEYGVH
ncbi:MAG: hypothetical protein AAGC78_00265 [Cellvibrio sp.]|uniref:hypothetical protein n=1 Tax=Cellvibrio sp. TaxID=1965322 RepID=UPI0031A2DD1C